MDCHHELPPDIQDRLPEGPSLTDWLLEELDRANAAAVRVHAFGCEAPWRCSEDNLAWLKTMLRALVLRHRARPTYVTNKFDPMGPDVPGGWYCQECGMDPGGSTDDWPCEVLLMVATILWHAQRPSVPVAWAWIAPEDQLIWGRGDAGGQTNGAGHEPVEPECTTFDGVPGR